MKCLRSLVAIALCLSLAIPVDAQQAYKVFRIWNGTAADTTAVGVADSTGSGNPTGVMGTRAFQRMYIKLKPNRPCRVALQVREFGSSDTSNASVPSDTTWASVFNWHGLSQSGVGVFPDSVAIQNHSKPTSVAAGSDELVVEFPADTTAKWVGPRGAYIPIRAADGTWYTGQFTTLRVRVLSAGGVVTWTGGVKAWAW